MKPASIALLVVFVALALFMALDIRAVAAPVQSGDTECVLWADIKPWAITRCESWEDATVCYLATSGFLQCFKED